jgi:hypothetical protein
MSNSLTAITQVVVTGDTLETLELFLEWLSDEGHTDFRRWLRENDNVERTAHLHIQVNLVEGRVCLQITEVPTGEAQLNLDTVRASGRLVSELNGVAVFYLSADGQAWCPACANQEDAEPPIVAFQTLGDSENDPDSVMCSGCPTIIHNPTRTGEP